MLKLKLQQSVHLMQRADSLEKTLMLQETEGKGEEGDRMRWLDASLTQQTRVEQTLGDGEGQGSLACCGPRGHKELDTT